MCNRRFAGSQVCRFASSLSRGVAGSQVPRFAGLQVLVVVLAVAGCVSPPLKARRPRPPVVLQDGTRIVDIRVPRQTERGTCAPVVTSGVLSYYGIPRSAGWLERRAGTTTDDGTDVRRLLDVLREEVLPGTGAQLREHLGFGPERFTRLFRAYNQLAEGHPDAKRLHWIPDGKLHVQKVLAHADPALLRQAANAQPGREAFWRDIRRAVDAGDPLLWGVVLGITQEPKLPPAAAGSGHFRLIVGYRAAGREIVFADPWGPGHAAKRMSLEGAWAETATLHSLHVP